MFKQIYNISLYIGTLCRYRYFKLNIKYLIVKKKKNINKNIVNLLSEKHINIRCNVMRKYDSDKKGEVTH